jgi:hypothetical protein
MSGVSSQIPATVISSLRNTLILVPDISPRYCTSVGERVVVVYHQDPKVAQSRSGKTAES